MGKKNGNKSKENLQEWSAQVVYKIHYDLDITKRWHLNQPMGDPNLYVAYDEDPLVSCHLEPLEKNDLDEKHHSYNAKHNLVHLRVA